MKRKIILLAGTFVVVLGAVGLFHLIAPGFLYVGAQGNDDDDAMRKDLPGMGGGKLGPQSRYGYGLEIIETAPDIHAARVKRIYRVKYWEKRDDGVYVLDKPEVKMFQKDGQQITITAKSGEVVAEWIEGKPRVISGFLEGDVKIFIDREKNEMRRKALPPENRPEVVRIYTEKINFSNPDLEIYTDRNITLFSKEGDIIGRGLTLSWSENPRELRYLKIHHGQQMIVHNAGGKSTVLMTPGQQADDEATATPVVVAAPADELKPPPPATTAPGVVESGPAATSQPATEKKRSNIFVANFFAAKQDIYVYSADRRMRGARKLALTFEFEPSSSSETSPEADAPEVEPVAPAEPSEPTEPIGPIDPDATDTIDSGGDLATTQPGTRPASTTQPAASKSEPLIIEWDGPLVLSPKGHTPVPSRKRYNIVATGKTVVLSDAESIAKCAKFTYNNLSQIGELAGSDARSAELLTAQGEEVVSKWIKFDRAKGLARLGGVGHMIRHIQPTPATDASTTRPTTQPTTRPADHPDRIDWSKSVLAIFGTQQRVVGRKVTRRQYIKETTFVGDVKLKQGKTGDFVNCDKLHVWMKRTSSGSVQPSKAVATGNAYARQEGSDIRGDEITVTFTDVVPTAAGSSTRSGDKVSHRVKPATLLAVGNVKINDKRGKEPVSATADRLVSNIIARTAVLTGSLAHLKQGPNTLSGRKIKLRQERITFTKPGQGKVVETRQYAKVIGKGNMNFLTDKDMSGRTLSKPRPIKIAWTDSMDYHPKKVRGGIAKEYSAADFKGNVTVDSGDDHMESQSMEALFAEPTRRGAAAPTTAPKTPVSLEKADSAGPVTMANYSQRKLIRLTADKKVVLTSHRLNPENALLRRVRLQGEHLVYNTLTGIVNMDKSGAMIAEDYRKPIPKAPTKTDKSQTIERPMLTVFQWKKSMELSQTERVVIMKGDVNMVHRSGAFVLSEIKGLKVPDYGKNVPAGRKTNLRCDELLAMFDPPKEKQPTTQPTTKPADAFDVGPKIGPLKFFNATGNVNLVDGSKQIVGQRLIYSRLKELIQVYGYLPNHPKANALIIDKNLQKQTEKVVKSPKILWWRATKANGYREKIEAKGVSID
jgi:lipopolysaccharide export system protein LptA